MLFGSYTISTAWGRVSMPAPDEAGGGGLSEPSGEGMLFKVPKYITTRRIVPGTTPGRLYSKRQNYKAGNRVVTTRPRWKLDATKKTTNNMLT